jgi:hypothetical protein
MKQIQAPRPARATLYILGMSAVPNVAFLYVRINVHILSR